MILFNVQEGSWLLESLRRDGVSTAHCRQLPGEVCPNSVVISCPSSGSRTILHTNLGMPELTTTDADANATASKLCQLQSEVVN